MQIEELLLSAHARGASDIHVEPGLPVVLRINSVLHPLEVVPEPGELRDNIRALLGEVHWGEFLERQSCDLALKIGGVRCRINVLRSMRGIGIAIRLLYNTNLTLDKLNLHPLLHELPRLKHGMVVISGPTGCGKSSTLAALINEINLSAVRHVITLESPIEYIIQPQSSIIRQREVGRDTPSFGQGLLDALREDPDVLMVGEMREPETLRLTLNAAQTGRVVYATVHSGSCIEALERIIGAFPAAEQNSVAAQLADCMEAIICQRLQFSTTHSLLLPICEILRSTSAVRACIRSRDFFKIASCIETGAETGMWTTARYKAWTETKTNWFRGASVTGVVEDDLPMAPSPVERKQILPSPKSSKVEASKGGVIEIEPFEGSLTGILKK